MSVYGLVARLVLVVVFAQAALPKVRSIGRFEKTVAKYRLLPQRTVAFAARLVVVAECAVVVLLAFGVEIAAGALLAALLLVGFAVAISLNLVRRRTFDCGCAGSTSKLISWRLVARDVLLAAAAVALAIEPGTLATLDAGWHAVTETMSSSTIVVVLVSTALLAMAGVLSLRFAECLRFANKVRYRNQRSLGSFGLGPSLPGQER